MGVHESVGRRCRPAMAARVAVALAAVGPGLAREPAVGPVRAQEASPGAGSDAADRKAPPRGWVRDPLFEVPDPSAVSSFPRSGARRVGALYHLRYRYPDEGLRDSRAPEGDPLTLHFPDPRRVSYLSASWHREQVDAMIDAGIDFLLVAHAPHPDGADESPSGRGIPFLVAALDEAAAQRGRAPRLGLYVDTRVAADETPDGWLDLCSPWDRDLLYAAIRDFAERVPPRHRAHLDGRLLVILGPAGRVLRYRSNLFDYLRARFAQEHGGTGIFLVKDGTWDLEADATLGWGGALAGPVIRDFAVIGPGYDDSRRPGGVNPVRDRENGAFYEKSWIEILRGDADLVVVRSWNGLHDGTAICETAEHRRRYLEITAEYTRLFRERRRVDKSIRLEYPSPRPRPDLSWGREAAGGSVVSWQGDFGFRDEDGITLGSWPDGPVRVLSVAGDRCAMTLGAGPTTPRYVYFRVSDYFLFDGNEPVVIELLYHESGGGTITLQYDAAEAPPGAVRAGAYRSLPTRVRTGEDRWERARWEIADARFANRQNGGADFRLRVDGSDLVLREVVVRKGRGGSGADLRPGAPND